MYIDIHSHQQNNHPDVLTIISRHGDFTDSFEGLYSVGIHPWYIHSDWEIEISLLEKCMGDKNLLAIGEIGLDKVCKTNYELQNKLFLHQASFAEKIEKPIIIHAVKSISEILSLHKKLNPKQAWIIHGFAGNSIEAAKLIQHGIYLSFGEALLHNIKLQETFKSIELSYVFFETDNDIFTPINTIYQMAADLKNRSIDDLCKTIEHNFNKIFKIITHE